MPVTPEYERNRLARVARNTAGGAAPLAHIKKLAGQLVYDGSGHEENRNRGKNAGSGSEYEPNDEEEADDANEDSWEEEEHDPTLLISKQASAKPQGRKHARTKPTIPITTRTTRASKLKPNQTEQIPSGDNDSSLLQTSKDSNTPQDDTEMQHSQDMTNTSCQIDSTVTVCGQVCSTRPTNPETSKRGKHRPTMGHGLQDYAKRNGGRKMKIEFSASRVRPLDPVQEAKLTSQCGIHVRSDMHVATHCKDYRKDGLDHHIPQAICHVAELCQKNKDTREAVKHQQTTGSRSYPSHFHQIKKHKYNNEDPSPIDFFKETHTKRKTGSMSTAALNAYTTMQNKKSEAQLEDEKTQVVADVLKEHSSSSTFLSTMGYQSRSRRSRTSASTKRVRELEERVEQQKREAIEAHEMYQRQLTERVKVQESALEEMQKKQQQEMEALKKSQEEKMKSYEKKQEETDNLISFLLRKHATQN